MSFRYQHGDRPLEGYTVLRGVGRGGFGEVYYAVSDGGREVALKSIMYNQEIELRGVRHCINLKNPHLVAIFDVRTGEDNTPFVIMEYVTGPSLRDVIREHPHGLGSQKAGYLVREIAKGLAYLHERGIVHRDLKPENIFYEEGFVKIGDYGLSKFISASHQSGQTMSVGTVHYMAPEIGSGNYHRGIDIYALGIILYEMLTGEVPFTGDSFGEILMKHLTVEPDLSRIEPPFDTAIRGALAKKPDDRFPNVEIMAKQIFDNDSLNSSVSLFNPATLSRAAERGHASPTAPGGNEPNGLGPAFAETVPVTPPPIPAAPIPVAPPPIPAAAATAAPPKSPSVLREEAALRRNAAAAAAEAPTRDGSRAHEDSRTRERTRDGHKGPGARSPRRRLNPTPLEAVPLDPLDSTQRLVRSLFVAILCVVGMRILPTGMDDSRGLFGFLLCAGGGAFGVLITEYKLARWLQVSKGFGWKVVALAVAALPVILGVDGFPGPREEAVFFAIMLSMLLVDWHTRLSPMREERVSFASGFTAGLCGAIFGGMFAEEPLFVGGVLATISLLVNAFVPFVPADVRRRWRRQAGEGDADDARPPEAATSPARGSPAAVRPPAPATIEESGSPETPGADAETVPAGSAYGPVRRGELPGFPARLFWLFVAATLVAGGLSCLIASFVIEFGPRAAEELLVCTASGLGLVGYSGFALYRGLWATRPSFWGRTLRPFLLVTAFNSTAISAACFTLGPSVGAWEFGREETIASIAVLLSSAFAFGVLLVADRLEPRPGASATSAHLPRHQRPLPILLRVLYLCLGGAAVVGSLVSLSVGTMARDFRDWDRFGALSAFVALGFLGLFLFRQGLRRRRGHLWSGAVRPFLLCVVGAGACVCTLPLILNLSLRDEETVAFIALGCFAVAFGVFVFFLRGPDETPESPLLDRFRDVLSGHQQQIASSWLGLGTVLWVLGVGVGLASVVVSTGLSRELHLNVAGASELFAFFENEGAWFASLLLLGASVSIVLARFGTGVVHVARAIIGQVAVLACVFLLSSAASRITVASGLQVHADVPPDDLLVFVVCGLLSGALGALLLAWPSRRIEPRSITEAAAPKEAA